MVINVFSLSNIHEDAVDHVYTAIFKSFIFKNAMLYTIDKGLLYAFDGQFNFWRFFFLFS